MAAEEKRRSAELPPLDDYCEWLVSTAQAIGLSNGETPTSYVEIQAWMNISGIDLTLWECELMRELSTTFINAIATLRGDDIQQPHLSAEGKRQLAKQMEERADMALSTSAQGTEYKRNRGR